MCADFRHILCQNHPLSRQIGWGVIYGARNQVLWLPCSILHSRVPYAAGNWQACLTAVIHSIHGEPLEVMHGVGQFPDGALGAVLNVVVYEL